MASSRPTPSPSIQRTATFAWSPSHAHEPRPLLASGTVSGALDASFSNEAQLEVWDPFADLDELGQPTVRAAVKTAARFNRLAWGYVNPTDRVNGVIAAGMENGDLGLYDPAKMMANDSGDALVYKHTQHSGPVRGLDFNKLQGNLLASGATNGEIFIWDLTNPQKPYSPGSRSRNLEDITSLAWNSNVAHVLATSSSSGYTVVWDLKGKREVVALNYNAAAASMQGGPPAWMGNAMPTGRRGGINAVCWHPENPTKLVTASDDDLHPIIMVWDLRNSMAPERILTGHEKGVLGLSWCSRDADLLLSSGKDCRNLCWNPSSGEIVGELPASSNWVFQTEWCPRNPGLVATASLDGIIKVDTLQSTLPHDDSLAAQPSGADIFDAGNLNAQQRPTMSLKQTPKWLRRPVSASFGFGGKLVTARDVAAPGAPHSSRLAVRQVVTEHDVVERALRLETATESGSLVDFCETRVTEGAAGNDDWSLLRTLFRADSRDELVTLLGFSKDEVRSRVGEAIRTFKANASTTGDNRSLSRSTSAMGLQPTRRPSVGSDSGSIAREPLVTFAETTQQQDQLSGSSEGEGAAASVNDATPSETSMTVSDGTKVISTEGAPTESSETTEPSLFGDEPAGGAHATTTQQQAAADFYSQIRSGRPAALPDHVLGQHAIAGSSVAATIGSRPSSAAGSEALSLKQSTFRIYPADESDADRLLTRALVLGDFESAVSLCLSANRFADAILLAVRGGPELLARTQKAYFERRTTSLPYLRLYQSIVTDDLDDIVQNADLGEWQEVFVVLCTFAKVDDFAGLVEQLGHRLEFQAGVSSGKRNDLRKHAVLCYLAAGRLEKVVTIWIEEMREQEQAAVADGKATSHAAAHAQALQSLVEKVSVFQSAVNYVDVDIAQPTGSAEVAESGARTYKLAPLYDRYREYAEVLAGQGLATLALRYVALTPSDYRGPKAAEGEALSVAARLTGATGQQQPKARAAATPAARAVPAAAIPPSTASVQQPYAYNANPQAPPTYGPYASSTPYQPTQAMPGLPNSYAPPPTTDYGYTGQYAPPSNAAPSPYAPPGQQQQQQQQQQQPYGQSAMPPSSYMPPPPPVMGLSPTPAQQGFGQQAPPPGPPPPPRVRDQGAWNDAPVVTKRTGSALGHRPNAIASPFPNMPASSGAPPMGGPLGASASGPPPPPSRSGTRTPVSQPVGPPPPRGRFASPPPPSGQPSFASPPQHGFTAPPSQYAPNAQYGAPAPRPQQQQPPPPPPGPGQPQQRPGFPPQQPSSAAPYTNGIASQQPPTAPSPYDPSPNAAGPPRGSYGPPPSMSGPGNGPPQPARAPAPPAPPVKPEPPKPKYPAGDRSHLTDATRPIYEILAGKVQRMRAVFPPQQKKMVDDTERRLNVLFDALNCETISAGVVAQIREIANAIQARNQSTALRLHLELLTAGSRTDDLSGWMPALKVVAARSPEL